MRFTALLLILMVLVSACGQNDKSFMLPVNYSCEAVMRVYTDKTENAYKVSIICRDGNFSIRAESENEAWNYAFASGNRCILNNDKFPESSVAIENFKIKDSLIYDFDFAKFDVLENIPEELAYWDGEYKHVLTFSKETFLPKTIHIYNKDKLVKAIEYERLRIEE